MCVYGFDGADNFSVLCARLAILSFFFKYLFQLLTQILLMILECIGFGPYPGGSNSRCACLQFLSLAAVHDGIWGTRTSSVVMFRPFYIVHIIHSRDIRSCGEACSVCSDQC